MLSLLIICFIAGGIGAILQGLVGIGTGIIIIPLLSFLLPYYGIDKDLAIHMALTTSMAVIVINSFSALASHHKRGNVQWPLFKSMALSSLCGAWLGALAASYTNGRYLAISFGTFMILTAIYMLFKPTHAEELDRAPYLSRPMMNTGGFSIGFIASIVGTGGGTLMVPFLQAFKVKMRYAVGTSILVGLPISAMGALTYIIAGMSKVPADLHVAYGYLHWPAFLAFSASGFLSAPIGAHLATILPTQHLQQVFAVLMFIVGIKMLF